MGALATDWAVNNGLSIPNLSDEIIKKVKDGAPEWMNVKNPLDVGPSRQFPKAFSSMMQDPDIHMVLAIVAIPYAAYMRMEAQTTPDDFFFGSKTPLREQKLNKPFIITVVSHKKLVDLFRNSFEPGIPVFTSPETATRSLAALWWYQQWKKERLRNNG